MMNHRAEADGFLAKIFGPGDQRIAPLTDELVGLLERAHADGAEMATQLVEQNEEEEESVTEGATGDTEADEVAAEPPPPAPEPKAAPPKKHAPPKRVLSAKPRPKKKR